MPDQRQKNVFGEPLRTCSANPETGFYRDGCCNTGPDDAGKHTVCVLMTREFLLFSRSRGNDLMAPTKDLGFPGLQPGDCWCLCVDRWLEAFEQNVAPPIVLEATHQAALESVPLEVLKQYAVDYH